MFEPLLAVSPLDGRYNAKIEPLQSHFSEFALTKMRLFIEIRWLIYICNELKLPNTTKLTELQIKQLHELHSYFDVKAANKVKDIEKTTNHDVKAVEYYLKEQLTDLGLSTLKEFIHFGCTSEDINNTAYGLLIKNAVEKEILPELEAVLKNIEKLAKTHKNLAMMGRTHGQPASPTTLGKEFINFAYRLKLQIAKLKAVKINGKFNGATGNYNAHAITYPKINWITVTQKFVMELGLEPNLWTTQIEPHDSFAEIFSTVKHANTIILDLATDIWSYISLNYFMQTLKEGEIGSSTMPHKVNPIDFENAEGNLEIANSLFDFFERKLMRSRLQRDLSDSTVLRNMGVAFGHSYLAYKSFTKGLSKLKINEPVINADLNNNWAILAEALQSIMRREGIDQPYEKLKELTRGKEVNEKTLQSFTKTLKLDAKVKTEMAKITPQNYTGLAAKLVDQYFKTN